MAMHDPPHPGEFITEIYLQPNHPVYGRFTLNGLIEYWNLD